jgi:hypothetical protein
MRRHHKLKFLNDSINSSVAGSGKYDTSFALAPISAILAGFIGDCQSFTGSVGYDKVFK